jgi:hypothetical protein
VGTLETRLRPSFEKSKLWLPRGNGIVAIVRVAVNVRPGSGTPDPDLAVVVGIPGDRDGATGCSLAGPLSA